MVEVLYTLQLSEDNEENEGSRKKPECEKDLHWNRVEDS